MYVGVYAVNSHIFIYNLIKDPDPSPNEFPIFNVSHNPDAPYPNPINHLYDKRYKQAYSTFIKQKQSEPGPSPSQQSEPRTPTKTQAMPSTQSTVNPKTYPAPAQDPYQQSSNNQAYNPNSGALPSRQQAPLGWPYVDPYAAYYEQANSNVTQPNNKQTSANVNEPVRRSTTNADIRQNGFVRSVSSDDTNYSTHSDKEKIRVSVINDNSAQSPSNDPNGYGKTRVNAPRSILKPTHDIDNNVEFVGKAKVYTTSNTDIGAETMQDLFQVVNRQKSEPAGSSEAPIKERVIIIDRRGGNKGDVDPNIPGQDRVRTFEIRSTPVEVPTSPISMPAKTPTPTPTPTQTPAPTTTNSTTKPTSTPTATTTSNLYAFQHPQFYVGQQGFYQQPKMYASMPNNIYSTATPFFPGAHNYYPFGYYRY